MDVRQLSVVHTRGNVFINHLMARDSLSAIVSVSLGNVEALESSEIGAGSGAADCFGVDISTISSCGPFWWPV